jgi:hypothetical protein
MAAEPPIIKPPEPISVRAILAAAWQVYRTNPRLLLALAAAAMFPGLLIDVLHRTGTPCAIEQLTWIGVLLIGTWAEAGLLVAAARTRETKPGLTVWECLAAVQGRYWRYLGNTMLYGLAVGFGLLLLIVPGIYFAAVYVMVPCIVLLEPPTATSAFARSRQLVKGSFWRVFVICLIGIALCLVLLSLMFLTRHPGWRSVMHLTALLSWFVSPFLAAASVELYYALCQRQAQTDVPAAAAEQKQEDAAARADDDDRSATGCCLLSPLAGGAVLFMISPWGQNWLGLALGLAVLVGVCTVLVVSWRRRGARRQ